MRSIGDRITSLTGPTLLIFCPLFISVNWSPIWHSRIYESRHTYKIEATPLLRLPAESCLYISLVKFMHDFFLILRRWDLIEDIEIFKDFAISGLVLPLNRACRIKSSVLVNIDFCLISGQGFA